MAKLWQKGYSLDALIEAFTVGRDYILDRELAVADVLGTIAHARMLESIELLTEAELSDLTIELRRIASDAARDEFAISREEEDAHTAIENRLSNTCGEAGKKVHTGRSRNDQVISALRVYGRSALLGVFESLGELAMALLELAESHERTLMAGRTHMQLAMPSTVGLWAAAFAEELLDDASLLRAAYDLVNRSALGAAASYGVPLPLDREMVARLLGFPRIQNNVLAVNNARGKTEAVVLDALEHLSGTASKLASDLILFSTPEFGYFELPETLCSGSSIMPQKRNPDGLELVRGKAGSIAGYAAGVKAVIRALPSGYNRDFQETKEPFLRGISETYGICAVMALTVRELRVNSAKLSEALRIELFATDEVFRLVREGQSFREAYRIVADQPKSVSRREVDQVLAARTATGTPGNLNLSAARSRLDEQLRFVEAERAREAGVIADLLGDSGIEIARAPY